MLGTVDHGRVLVESMTTDNRGMDMPSRERRSASPGVCVGWAPLLATATKSHVSHTA